MRDEIDRLRTNQEEELFHARLRLGMLDSGEVVYQFPHGRDTRRLLEDPTR
jgi:cell division protein FtsB